jgi:uncharacterized iron-regulated protein
MRRLIAFTLAAALCGCAAPSPTPELIARIDSLPASDVLLLGEQHDTPQHQDLHRQVVELLAARGRLAAVAVEMAEQGTSTAGLPRDASEEAVQSALRWGDAGWPWQPYRPAVMAAVAAGVPVMGANLPRAQLRTAMADVALDALLPAAALKAQQDAIRVGHCQLLPEGQIQPMTRVQIARDRAMAQTLAKAAVPGKTVVLLAGVGHVNSTLGVPLHMPNAVSVQSAPHPPKPSDKDYCGEMSRAFKRKP